MLCAHAIGRCKPGSFDEFVETRRSRPRSPLVEDVISNGAYEIIVSRTVDGAAA